MTQMYFPGDPLLRSTRCSMLSRPSLPANDLIASFDLEVTEPEWALGYRFDIVLRGRDATPMDR